MINTEERTLTPSPCAAVIEVDPIHIGRAQICAPLSFISQCLLKNEPIALCLSDFYLSRTVFMQKNIWRNLTVIRHFGPVVKMSPKLGKTSL